MTTLEFNRRRALIVRRARAYRIEHGLEEPRRRTVRGERANDEGTEHVGFEDPLDILPDLG